MSNQHYSLLLNLLIYSDGQPTNQPILRDLDYTRQLQNLIANDSFSKRFTVAPQSSLGVMSVARTLSQDATTQYRVYQYGGNVFRWVFAGGTNPVLKTKRILTIDALTQFDVTKTGDVVRYTWNTIGGNPNFVVNGTIVGDQVHIESGGNFNALNCGTFTIVNVGAAFIEVVNETGAMETGIALGAPVGGIYSPMQVFANDGIQMGDEVKISSLAFNIENRGAFTLTGATAEWFELANGNPGIAEGPIAVGSATGIVFYPSVYKFVYIESDQEIAVRLNGASADSAILTPVVLSVDSKIGLFIMHGEVWQLTLINNGINAANVLVCMLE